MLVDFAEIKRKVQHWIDENLDHNMLLCRDDPLLPILRERGERVFEMDCNPTAGEHRPAHLRTHQEGRAAGRRGRALGNRALLRNLPRPLEMRPGSQSRTATAVPAARQREGGDPYLATRFSREAVSARGRAHRRQGLAGATYVGACTET